VVNYAAFVIETDYFWLNNAWQQESSTGITKDRLKHMHMLSQLDPT
jgi:hypothetical protein